MFSYTASDKSNLGIKCVALHRDLLSDICSPCTIAWWSISFTPQNRRVDLEVSMDVIKHVIVVVEARRTYSESLLRDFLRCIPKDKLATVVLNKV